MVVNFKGQFGAQFSKESCAKIPFITGRQAVYLNIFCRLSTICRGDSQNSLPVPFQRGGWASRSSNISRCDSCWRIQQVRVDCATLSFILKVTSFLNVNFNYYCLWNLFFIFRTCSLFIFSIALYTRQQNEVGTYVHLMPVCEFQNGLWCWGPLCSLIQDWRAHSLRITLISDMEFENFPWWKPRGKLPFSKRGRVCSEKNSHCLSLGNKWGLRRLNSKPSSHVSGHSYNG